MERGLREQLALGVADAVLVAIADVARAEALTAAAIADTVRGPGNLGVELLCMSAVSS